MSNGPTGTGSRASWALQQRAGGGGGSDRRGAGEVAANVERGMPVGQRLAFGQGQFRRASHAGFDAVRQIGLGDRGGQLGVAGGFGSADQRQLERWLVE